MAEDNIKFDFAACRARLGLTREVMAQTMGVSESHYCKLEREGAGRKLYAWAAYGVECAAKMNSHAK